MEIIDKGKLNPCIVLTPEDVLDWLRSVADENGYDDRDMSGVQIQVEQPFGDGMKLHNETPQLVLMLSNIPYSRPR